MFRGECAREKHVQYDFQTYQWELVLTWVELATQIMCRGFPDSCSRAGRFHPTQSDWCVEGGKRGKLQNIKRTLQESTESTLS